MTGSNRTITKERTAGDAAVDGLLAGIMAGLIMAVYLVAAGLLAGDRPVTVLGQFDPGQNGSALLGLVTHLAVSAIYGVIFAVIERALLRNKRLARSTQFKSVGGMGWLLGLVYGLLLLIVAQVVIQPTGNSPFVDTPVYHIVIAHLLYGLALGVMVGRNE